MPEWFDLAIHGGNIGFVIFALYVGYKFNSRMNRDESIRADYPPHRHVNGGRVIYPAEYQPSKIEHMDFEDRRES